MKRKLLIFFTIIITLINTILPIANAAEITKADLINDHSIKTHIKYYTSGNWYEIKCNYICYKMGDEKYPAYCILPGTHGVDEEGDYTVKTTELLKDKLIYNIILNGYPYKTASQLGVETNDDAYVATKHAIRSVLLNRDIMSFYKASDEKGEKIIKAIYNIAEKGKIGNESNKDATLKINKVGSFNEENNYYYQEYSVTSDVNISEYEISKIEDFPSGSYVSDTNGNKKSKFANKENFRVKIPKSSLEEDILGKININATCNTKPIFYGEPPSSNVQSYAVTYKPYAKYTSSATMKQSTNTASIKIVKKDKETSIPIENVIFGLYKDGKLLNKGKTDKNGIIKFSNLYQGEYNLKELETNENYVKDDKEYKVTAKYNQETVKEITNIYKKGNINIIKVDKEDKNVRLSDVEFEVVDSNKKIIANVKTDKNGEARISNINIGDYVIKETKARDNYKSCNDNNITVRWNETSKITIENEKKKGQIKIIKEDKDDSNIRLKNVEFQIIKDDKVVEVVKTDEKGEAITSKLPIGEYKIKEINLGNNLNYILNDSEIGITIEEDKTKEIIIKNEHKKGNLKITKVDKDDNKLTLDSIEFDLLDCYNKLVTQLITDVNGEAYIDNINIGSYTLKETKTKKEYNLCTDENIIVEWNKTTEKIIENEKKKGQIKVIKEDQDFSNIKLEGVKFEVLDWNNKIVEVLETDEKGEAVTSRLPIGEYKIKEIELGSNTEYLLNNTEYITIINENQITELNIKNEHKKGKLEIFKVDKDDIETKIEGVEFEITDEEGNKYKTITNKNGIATVDNIRTGKAIIEEIKTDDKYVLLNTKYEIEISKEQCSKITIENEKKKGQVAIYKIDKENNEIKIPLVEFEILDKNNNVVDKLITNKDGYAISKKLPIGEYYIKETQANENYILNIGTKKVIIQENEVTNAYIENEKIKGKIKIIKISSTDSPILNIQKGDYIANVEFEIYNSKNELVEVVTTNQNGEAISNNLEKGRYKVIEKNTSKGFILNDNIFFVNIETNNEVKILNVKNDPIIPNIDIEKIGQECAEKNEEIKYEFNISNKSNISVKCFTLKDKLPYEKIKVTKMITGVYNQNIDYSIYYKTNQNDYKLLKKVNSLKNEYIDFNKLDLSKNEEITEIKVEYGTVNSDFKNDEMPSIFVKVKETVNKNEKITNEAEISGQIDDFEVKDKSIFETIVKEKEIVKKLPKTGC